MDGKDDHQGDYISRYIFQSDGFYLCNTCMLRALFKYHARMVSLLAYTNIDNVSICFPFVLSLCQLFTQSKALREQIPHLIWRAPYFHHEYSSTFRGGTLTPRDLAIVSSCVILRILFIVMIRFALCLLTISKGPMGKGHSQNAGFHLIMVFSYPLPCPRPFSFVSAFILGLFFIVGLFKYDISFFDVIFRIKKLLNV